MNSRNYARQQEGPAKVSKLYRNTVQLLKDLIRINKDRITGYEKAAFRDNGMDPNLRSALSRMATESRSYVNDLHAEVIRLGGAPVTQETITGKIYFFWLDLKADFGSNDASPGIPSLLNACGCGEEAMQKAYRQALLNEDDLPDYIIHLLERQLGALERSHEEIKNISSEYSDNSRSL
jgi:uncharacterized protein (TIGR02284 family)